MSPTPSQVDLIKDFLLAPQQHAIKKKAYDLLSDQKHPSVKATGSVELSLAFIPNTVNEWNPACPGLISFWGSTAPSCGTR